MNFETLTFLIAVALILPIIIIDIKFLIKDKKGLIKTIIAVVIGFVILFIINNLLPWRSNFHFYDRYHNYVYNAYNYYYIIFGINAVIAILFGPTAGFLTGINPTAGLFGLLIGLFKYKLGFSTNKINIKNILLFTFIYVITFIFTCIYIQSSRIYYEHFNIGYIESGGPLPFFSLGYFYINIVIAITTIIIYSVIEQKRIAKLGITLTQHIDYFTIQNYVDFWKSFLSKIINLYSAFIKFLKKPRVKKPSYEPTKSDTKKIKPTPSTILDKDFIKLLKRMKSERGFSIFEDYTKCNSLLKDYSAGEYKKECRLLLLAIEAGCPGEIARSTEPEITKNKLLNRLHDEYLMDLAAAEQVVDWLYEVYEK